MNEDLTSPTSVLFKAVEILSGLQYDYFLCNGTLLGVIRDSQLIPWDTDLDIGLGTEIDRDELCTQFINQGFKLYDYGPGSDYLILKFGAIKVDFNFFHPRDHELITLWSVPRRDFMSRKVLGVLHRLHIPSKMLTWCWTLEGYALPIEMTLPIREIDFLGRQVRVPSNPEAVLAYTYGESWKVPNQGYDWRKDGHNNAHG